MTSDTRQSAASAFAPALAYPWTVLVSEDGTVHAAFLRGHLLLEEIIPSAETDIIAAAARLSKHLAADLADRLDAAGGAAVRYDWMRMTAAGDGDFFEFCPAVAKGAFPVTAVRFH